MSDDEARLTADYARSLEATIDAREDEVERLRALLREAHQALLNCTHPGADTVPSSECAVCELQQRIGRATDPDLYAAPLTVAQEPTEAMKVAGARSLIDGQESRPGSSWADEAALCYGAMVAAASRGQG